MKIRPIEDQSIQGSPELLENQMMNEELESTELSRLIDDLDIACGDFLGLAENGPFAAETHEDFYRDIKTRFDEVREYSRLIYDAVTPPIQ